VLENIALRAVARGLVRRLAFFAIGIVGVLHRFATKSPETSGEAPHRILVIRVDLLGDVLFSMTAVDGLRKSYPQARIVMLTLPYTAPLARLYPSVDEVVAVDTNRIRSVKGLVSPQTWVGYWRAYRYVRDQRFDLCLSLHGRMASLCAFLSGATRTIGYAAEAYPFLLTDAIGNGRYGERIHEVEYVRRLAKHAGASQGPEHLHVPVPADASEAIEGILLNSGISKADKVVVIHVGSVHSSAKRWPPDCWAQFADSIQENGSARVVLTGSRSERSVAREVLERATKSIVSLVGETSIEELIALIARADLVASGDSGPLHLAVALNRPVLAAYGPTDPLIYGPYRPVAPAVVHRRDLACSPCYPRFEINHCRLGDPICMRLITVDQMVSSALELLRENVKK
jgi:lipopolysaccharide heptosyltransferase II